jgi:hydrogenase/urease accessory protein HupE
MSAAGGPDGPDGVRLTATWSCPGGGPVAVHIGFLAALPPGHVHLARIEAGGTPREEVADGRRDGFSIEPAGSAWGGLARLVGLGVEHILSGWDHLAFLFALLLASARIRSVLAVVTGFTVGHAITLALATLGAVTAPASIVEPLIAASVVVVAAQNLRELRSGTASGHARWPLAATFGLVHGFGFAGALAELQLPRAGLAASLLSFNLGVELGQALVVAAVFPVLILVRRRPRLAAAGLPMGSLAVGCAGLIWLVQRVGGGLGG